MTNIRDAIAEVVYQVMEEKKHSDTVLHQVLNDMPEDLIDRSRLKREAYGIIEQCIRLDDMINRFSKVKVHKMKAWVRTALRMGTYEICFMENVPESATCNEMVELVVRHGYSQFRGFTNGVLRTICREYRGVETKDVSVQYSMPEWIVELLQNNYGKKTTKKILASFLEVKPITLRIDESKISREELMSHMPEDISCQPGFYLEETLNVTGVSRVEQIYGYAQGLFAVQDESSMLPVYCSGIKPGDRVLDLCAAPGGKTMQAAGMTGDEGIVESRDVSEYKISKIKENVARMGYHNVTCKVWDATISDPAWLEKADVVIADVPCSGLGIIGRKPDIKYMVTKESADELVRLQRNILKQAVSYVKPGGVLMYSTCTLNPAENKEQVFWLIEQFDFELESLDDYLPELLKSSQTKEGMLQILPGIHKTDGFFLARLRKKED